TRRPSPGALSGRRPPRRVCSKEALLPLRLGRPARAGIDLGAEARGHLRAALDEIGRLVRVDGVGAKLVGDRLELLGEPRERIRLIHAETPFSPWTAPRTPLIKPGAS